MTSYNSVTFNSNGSIADTSLEEHVRPNNVLADNQRHTVGIQTNTKSFSSFNTGSDAPAQTTSGTMRVQLHQDDGLVRVGGLETKPEVAEALRKQAPELFVEPAVQQAQAQAKAEEAKAEEISREELNRHPDEIEGYHQHINDMVSQESLIGLMVYAQKGEAPPADLLKTIARDMGESVDSAIAKVNLVNQGVQAQFTVLARSMGLDADKAADWLREHRKDSSMSVLQAHYLRRNLAAWKPLLADYRAATGDGIKR